MAAMQLNIATSGVLFVLLLSVTQTYGGYKKSDNCDAVRSAYHSKGYNREEVPANKIQGDHLIVCPQEKTCCTRTMETSLALQSQTEFDKALGDKISLLRNTLISRTAKFDAFFTELLDNSKQDLHDMFVRTYGLLYQQNSHIFTNLYDDLRNYYKGKEVNLLDALDGFFIELLQRMFELLNTQYDFDKDYLECVTESMDELKPFGDVPAKLSIQVKRAFIAARTFVQGLAIGRDVIIEVSKLPSTPSCTAALMKMMHCPYCEGIPYVRPCNNYCMNIMKGCLAHQADLNKYWNDFIDSLMKVADRLEGPFNIESVVDPIDVKISDAIMNFQESSETVKTKVFEGCGQPRLGKRKKREAAAASSYDEYAYGWKYEQKQFVRPTTAAGTSLDRLVRDIKKKVETAKDFWRRLPHQLCNDMAAPMMDESNCWNGDTVSRYQPDVMKDGTVNQINNPEVEVNVHRANAVINQQILHLKQITSRLKNAYNGLDVDWIDTADTLDGGSGSGYDASGSGSGYGTDRVDDGIVFSNPTERTPQVVTRKPPNKSYDNDYQGGGGGASTVIPSIFLVVLLPLLLSTRWQH